MSGNYRTFEDMQSELKSVRSLIDEIDGTSFGKLEHLFDRMAKVTDRAIALADDLEVNVDWSEA